MFKKILVDWFGVGTRTITRAEADNINAKGIAELSGKMSADTLEKITHFFYDRLY